MGLLKKAEEKTLEQQINESLVAKDGNIHAIMLTSGEGYSFIQKKTTKMIEFALSQIQGMGYEIVDTKISSISNVMVGSTSSIYHYITILYK